MKASEKMPRTRRKSGFFATTTCTDEVKRYRPVNFTDSKTQPFHERSPSPWQQRAPSLIIGALPYEGAGHCPGFSRTRRKSGFFGTTTY